MNNNQWVFLISISIFLILSQSFSCLAQDKNKELIGNFTIMHIDTSQVLEFYNFIKVVEETSNDTLNVLVNISKPNLIDTLFHGFKYQMQLRKMSKIKVEKNRFIKLYENKFYANDKLIFENKDNTYLLLSIKEL